MDSATLKTSETFSAPADAPVVDACALDPSVLADILDGATLGVVIHRGEAPLFMNRAMMRMLGMRPTSRSLRKPVIEWLNPEDRARHVEMFRARMRGENESVDQEFRLIREDGGELWIICRENVIDWQGEPAILATCHDATPYKLAELAQARSEALFKRVFQATPDMVALAWLDTGVFLDVNENLAAALGMSRREVMGQSIFDLGIWDDPHMAMRVRAIIRRDGSIRQMEATARRADRTIFPISFSAETLTVDDRDVVLVMCRDITLEKAREEELRASRDAAEAANRTKSEFLANISHELRTPLNAVIGFSEVIRDEMLGPHAEPRYRDYAEDIHRSGSHLLEIINDILDLSKVEAGRLDVCAEPFDVPEIATQAVRILHDKAKSSGIILSQQYLPDSFQLELDRRLFKQILINLLSNAIKFTPSGGRVAITISRLSDPAGCKLQIADTGIGMSHAEIREAMKPFRQVDSSFTKRHDGTGLGLPLVSAFVNVLGGEVVIDSEPGKGTTVTVTLPEQSDD